MEAQLEIRDGRIENMLYEYEDEVGACYRDVKYFHQNRVSWGDESPQLEGAPEVNIHAGENAQTEEFCLLNMKIEVESDTETGSESINNAGEIGAYDYDYSLDENSSSSSVSVFSSGSEWESPISSAIGFPLPPASISQPIWSGVTTQFSQLQMETDSEDSASSFVNGSGFHYYSYYYNFTDGTSNPRSIFPGSSTWEIRVPSFVGPRPVFEPFCTGTPIMEYSHLEMNSSDSESDNSGDGLVDKSGAYDDNSCSYNLQNENSIKRFVFSGPNNACENSNSFVVDFVSMPEREHIWTETPVEYTHAHQADPETVLGNSGNVWSDETANYNYDISYNLDGNYITRVVLPGRRSENHTPFVIDFVPASAPETRNLAPDYEYSQLLEAIGARVSRSN